jgi:hypothetical protein
LLANKKRNEDYMKTQNNNQREEIVKFYNATPGHRSILEWETFISSLLQAERKRVIEEVINDVKIIFGIHEAGCSGNCVNVCSGGRPEVLQLLTNKLKEDV